MVMCWVVAMAAVVAPVLAQTPEEVSKIKGALPTSATVKPAKKHRKLLVFSLATSDRHDSIPYGETAFQLMGEATGAYEATLSQDMSVFQTASLSQFDAILMNNTSGELFTTPSLQRSLLDFVRSGKGFAGIHAAASCCTTWPSYGDMIGGYSDGYPWKADFRVRVKIDDPNHPVAKAFGGAGFDITEGIYQFKDPFSRHKLRVLASLDTEKLDLSQPGVHRADKDFPVSWVSRFGSGRVFYCSLGHNKDNFYDSRVLRHYLDGIQFVLGDLKADAKPVPAIALEKQNEAFDVAEASLKEYDYGKAQSASAIFDSLTRGTTGAPAARSAYVARLAAVATSPRFSVAARELTLRQIPYSARENDVAGLFPLLKDDNLKIAEMTRYALAPIAGASVSRAFREAAASTTSETLKAGLIRALGTRRDRDSVSFVAGCASHPSPAVASASVDALGRIGSPESAAALQKVLARANDEAKTRVGNALAECASNLESQRDYGRAGDIYKTLLKEKGSFGFRLAAFAGLARLSPKPSDLALATLLGKDSQLHSAAGTLLTAAKDSELNRKLAAAIKGQTPENQIALLGIIKSRRAREAMEPARELLSAQTSATRSAAIAALGSIGDATVVPDLLKIAASKDDEFGNQARTCIDQLTATEVDDLLIRLIDPHKAAEATRPAGESVIAEAIRAIARRELAAATPMLLENARLRKSESLKAESYDALIRLVRAEDAGALLEMNYQVTSPKVRTKADRALLAAIRKMKPVESQSAFLVDAIEPAPSAEARASILSLLGKLGGRNSYEALKKFLSSKDEAIKDAAIRSLAEFPTADAIDDCIAIARDESAEKVHRVLAFRGAARMLGLELKRGHKETLQLVRTVLELAATDEDRKLVVANVAELKEPGIIELIEPLLGTEAMAIETSSTILKLAPHVWRFSPRETSRTLARIIDQGLNDSQTADLKKVTEQMDALTSAVTGWQAAGPYTDPAAQDLEKLLAFKFGPETSGTDSVDWKPVQVGSDSANPDMLDLEKALGPTKNGVAYLRTFLIADAESTETLRVRSDDGSVVWMNGREVLSAPQKGERTVSVSFSSGKNELLAKVTQGEGAWRVSVLVESPGGGTLPGVSVKTFPE